MDGGIMLDFIAQSALAQGVVPVQANVLKVAYRFFTMTRVFIPGERARVC